MEENEKQEEIKKEEIKQEETKTIDTEELKKQAAETVGQVKSTVKNIKIKDETINTKNFVKDMIKDPISKTTEISKDSDNKFLKTSIFIVIIWMAAEFLFSVLSYRKYNSFGRNVLSILKSTLSPACIVLALTLIIFIVNKKHKKSLTTILSTVVTVYSPMVIASILHLLYLIDYNMAKLTTPITALASFITVVLSYFAMKDIFQEETELGTFKKFVLVELIYFAVAIVVSLLGISMYI